MRNRSKPKTVINGTKPQKTPDRASATRIRSALLFKGITLGGWAKKKGYSRNTVWQAAYKLRAGRLARKIRAELEQLLDA